MAAAAILGIRNLGQPIPPDTEHAISVSLPTWQICIDYRAGKQEVKATMKTGYPRMLIHINVIELAAICHQKFGTDGEKCLLTSSRKVAEQAAAYIRHQAALAEVSGAMRHVQHTIHDSSCLERPCAELHIVFYHEDLHPFASEFWECTGPCISSRFAEYCLCLLSHEVAEWGNDSEQPGPAVVQDKEQETSTGHGGVSQSPGSVVPLEASKEKKEGCVNDRFSRDQNVNGPLAKKVLRKRIAMALVTGKVDDSLKGLWNGAQDVETGHNDEGVQDIRLSEDDVFLYPAGMTAVWNAYNLCLRARPSAKSVIFGMPYFETLKIVRKWGPGAHFYAFGDDSDMDALERLLAEEFSKDPTKPPILALFTELPSNPLLSSPDIPRLRALADIYDFLLIIDETLGNFVNIEVLPYADIVLTSLTKIFSGVANVMGGSLVLNPKGRHYATLVNEMADFEDVYYDADAVVMERNSRDLVQRVRIIDANTEALCDYLRERSVAGGVPSSVIKEVHYPKYTDTNKYLQCKRPEGGFGGLFSLTFKRLAAAKAFFDTIPCYKGPTLGTNFTLALPYTILAFPKEIAWAEQHGVPEALVRLSVGMEDKDLIIRAVDLALRAAQSAQ